MFDRKRLASTEFYQYRFRNFATMIVIPTSCVIVLIFTFMLFAKREVTVRTVGELIPAAVPESVQSTSNAQIVSNRLSEGKYVRKGTTLLVYHNVQTKSERRLIASQKQREQGKVAALKTLRISIETGRDQFQADDEWGYRQQLKDYLAQFKAFQLETQQIRAQHDVDNRKADDIQRELQVQIDQTNLTVADYQNLYTAITKSSPYATNGTHQGMYHAFQTATKGLGASDKQKVVADYAQQIQTQIESMQANLDGLKLQKVQAVQEDTSSIQASTVATKQDSLRADTLRSVDAQTSNTRQELASITEKMIELKDDAHDYRIKAPASGVLHINSSLSGKQRISGGVDLAQIMPKITTQHLVKVTLYVSPTAITSIHRGQKVRFKLARDVPEPIIIDAKVVKIDAGPTVTKAGNVFKVTANVGLTATQARKLHYGMQGQASIITGKKTYWHYIVDQLFCHES